VAFKIENLQPVCFVQVFSCQTLGMNGGGRKKPRNATENFPVSVRSQLHAPY